MPKREAPLKAEGRLNLVGYEKSLIQQYQRVHLISDIFGIRGIASKTFIFNMTLSSSGLGRLPLKQQTVGS